MTSIPINEHAVECNGVAIHVARTGNPSLPPLLMIHGIYDEWRSWSPVLERFAAEYHLIGVDLRGHGRSSKPDSGYEVSDYADDVASLLRTLDLDPVFVVGHSLGALTTTFLAASYPELVRALVLEDPPIEFDRKAGSRMRPLLDVKRGSEHEAYNLFREMGPQLGEERWRDQARRLRNTADGPFEAVIRWGERGQAPDILGEMERIQCPALLVQADPISGASLSDTGAEQAVLSLNHGELRKFEDTGHSIHKERPDEFASAVLEFLSRWKT